MAFLRHKRSILTEPIRSILGLAEWDTMNHDKCIRDMKREFAKMDYNVFLALFTKSIECAMRERSASHFGFNTILFLAKFATSCNDRSVQANTLANDIFKWTLKRTAANSRLRQRLCEFLRLLVENSPPTGVLNRWLKRKIMQHLKEVLKSVSSRERTEAIRTLKYFQNDSKTDTEVLELYEYHLSCDPNSQVRKTVLNCIVKTPRTIPWILERTLECDKRVRQYAYRQLGDCPLRSLTMDQRLTCLERGLAEADPMVLQEVSMGCLPKWKQPFNDNLIEMLKLLNQTENESEVVRFRKVTRLGLRAIFGKETTSYLTGQLPICDNAKFGQCVPYEQLTAETALYWQYLVEFLNEKAIMKVDEIIPDLSAFCGYVFNFFENKKDSLQPLEAYQIGLSLMDLLASYDFRDEQGRKNCDLLLTHMLREYYVHEEVTAKIVACLRQLFSDEHTWLQQCAIIVKSIIGFKSHLLKNELLSESKLKDALVILNCGERVSSNVMTLQKAISELVERETDFIKQRNYYKSQELSLQKRKAIEKFTVVLKHLLAQPTDTTLHAPLLELEKHLKDETIVQSLRIVFCMLKQSKDPLLQPVICKFYYDIINHHILAETLVVRSLALKCGISFCLQYSPAFAKFMFCQLNRQFDVPHVALWETCASGLFEILHRYGLDHFNEQNSDDNADDQCTPNSWEAFRALMLHILKDSEDDNLKRAIICGFCRLTLDAIIDDSEVIETLLDIHLDPNTAPVLDNVLRSFFKTAIERKLPKTVEIFEKALSKQAICDNSHKVAAATGTGRQDTVDMPLSDVTDSEENRSIYSAEPEAKRMRLSSCMQFF